MNRTARSRSPFIARALFIGGCVALVVVISAIVREAQRRSAWSSEIRAMESEIARLEQQRSRISDILKDAETPEFLEREARLRLGLQKPGETVLIVPDGAAGAQVRGAQTEVPPASSSNAAKWWRGMFR